MPTISARVRFYGNRMLVNVDADPFAPAAINALLDLDRLHPLTSRTSDPEFFELLDLVVAFYALDRSFRRPYDGWARRFVIEFPVARVELWRRYAPLVGEWLRSTTGDVVDVFPVVRKRAGAHHDRQPTLSLADRVDVVGLVSDGLDSLCGVDAAARDCSRRLALATVGTSGTRLNRISKVALLASSLAGYHVEHLRFGTKLYRKRKVKEKTQRSRTVLALVTGLTAAYALGASTVESYENGFGTLNLPIPDMQYGAMSAQVLQPRYLPLWDRVSRAFFEADIRVRYPNRFVTKAEMIARLSDEGIPLVRDAAFSCDSECRESAGILHCGRCGSCCYRRLSVAACGRPIEDATYAMRQMNRKEPDAALRLRYHAELLAEALETPDPWTALLRLQPELRGVAEAEEGRAPAAEAARWRDEARKSTIALLRRHVAEVAEWQVRSDAA
jgi:hypothetical protein